MINTLNLKTKSIKIINASKDVKKNYYSYSSKVKNSFEPNKINLYKYNLIVDAKNFE